MHAATALTPIDRVICVPARQDVLRVVGQARRWARLQDLHPARRKNLFREQGADTAIFAARPQTMPSTQCWAKWAVGSYGGVDKSDGSRAGAALVTCAARGRAIKCPTATPKACLWMREWMGAVCPLDALREGCARLGMAEMGRGRATMRVCPAQKDVCAVRQLSRVITAPRA